MGRRSLTGRRTLIKRSRRKTQLIDTTQQFWFALTLFLYAVAIVLFLWVTLLPDASLVENPVGESFLPLILQHFVALCVQNPWSMLFTFLFLAFCAVLFSHQLFGPMRRFESIMLQKRENLRSPLTTACGKPIIFSAFQGSWTSS